MSKKTRWQLVLILTVLVATLYNILPTLIYYSKGLNQPVGLFEAEAIAESIEKRLQDQEKESVEWVRSYCNLIGVKPQSVSIVEKAPQQIQVTFAKLEEAKTFRALLPRAGSLIPFAPARLTLPPQEEEKREVLIQRSVPCRLQKEWLHYVPGGLVLDSGKVGEKIKEETEKELASHWHPQHMDFQEEGVLRSLFDPDKNCLYVSLKSAERLGKLYAGLPECDLTQIFSWDIQSLVSILYAQGFHLVPASAAPLGVAEAGDLVFENSHYVQPLLTASREKFITKEGKPFLPLTNREERMLTQNRIDSEIQSGLVQWGNDYRAAQVHLDPKARFDVPKPTRSAFWNNLLLSAKKYLRGDERKILRWGLDLSGGKSVQIELIDANGDVVKEDAHIKKGIEELTKRVNGMGVSEVSIRQLSHQIVLDFPGSQAMDAKDLIAASTLTFHVVNETFSLQNGKLAESVNRFLQDVWNEAILTNRKDLQGLNAIAARRLTAEKKTDAAQQLFSAGLRLTPDLTDFPLSKIAAFRGEDRNEWHGQNHPLIILFKDPALEGTSLTNIHAGYDPSKGNFLSFEVKEKEAKDRLYSWASTYCKENLIIGTELFNLTKGRGWRMAALLNDTIISTPSLEAPLRDGGMISGSFSPREVNILARDLEAGSLSFTPRILLEKNIHPELGKSDRTKGIVATALAFILVVSSMLLYYRFAGLVASVAVLINLLILWAVLQNLEAVLTLGSIAGIILTVGMSVDANVLVFERIKEELARSGSLQLAIDAGYKKAYGAIIDSNLTTLIAALILLNFHAGPIQSFALNLLIGIISSLFTALFMTRFYFNSWLRRAKNPVLTMKNWLQGTHIPFFKWTKLGSIISSLIICIGCFGVWSKRDSVLGLDFTGGYATHLELKSGNAASLKKALLAGGASPSDVQTQELYPSTQVRLFLASALELEGKPFYGMAKQEAEPRIHWIIESLQKEGLELTPVCIAELPSNWTAMSGQISDTMRTQAFWALSLAFLAIFIYLAFRFEIRYSVASLLCLVFDLLITLGTLGLLHFAGVDIQIDLTTIAALMTIIGYSLNDKIIVFDRVREEKAAHPQRNFLEIVNASLNATLSRTTITSGTTLLVLLSLLIFGGHSLFSFALTMTIGVSFGTLSSWFIASPLLVLLHSREKKVFA
ncbi:MAG TPA: protein translocase subunit SecD [Chlamydiales bacterium]|nr:protein translocase subunit SecD [Chlamydiales bacterium]